MDKCALSVAEAQAFCPQKGSYIPGTPGGPWTEDEVLIVKEKVRFMINSHNHEALFHRNENFPPITNLVYGDSKLAKWHPNDTSMDYYRNMTFSRSSFRISPTPRKLIQLAFHDCLKNIDSATGEHFGGCDGCLNWKGMDFLNQIPMGKFSEKAKPRWPSYRAMPIKYKTDNNKLSTTAMALELVYTDPNWPPGAPVLASSLFKTGKSRADLWQLAANTALEIEIIKANYGCSHKVSYQQMVMALEGKEKCLWKLQKPVPFQYGRADCVRDERLARTKFPFEATNEESHSNPFGEGRRVLEDLKMDFGMSARHSIALMAAHSIMPAGKNKVLAIAYRWGGSPFLSNMYFKTLGGAKRYEMGNQLMLRTLVNNPKKMSDSPLLGDEFGRPLAREMQGDFNILMRNWWNTSLPDSGPWFFRPLREKHSKRIDSSLKPRKPCFSYNYASEMYKRLDVSKERGNPEYATECLKATINQETGVQTGGPPVEYSKATRSFAFYLPYEMGFVKNFTVDAENHPRGCNLPEVFTKEYYPNEDWVKQSNTAVTCERSTYKLAGEEKTSADIVDEFAEDHEVWANAFIEGWQVLFIYLFCKCLVS